MKTATVYANGEEDIGRIISEKISEKLLGQTLLDQTQIIDKVVSEVAGYVSKRLYRDMLKTRGEFNDNPETRAHFIIKELFPEYVFRMGYEPFIRNLTKGGAKVYIRKVYDEFCGILDFDEKTRRLGWKETKERF